MTLPTEFSSHDLAPVDFEQVLERERDYLGLTRGAAKAQGSQRSDDSNGPWALCLSGGGIRSATFCLGILQGLAERGLLAKFHYLSTVSGGGYIGSWLSRWIHEQGGKVGVVESALAGTSSGAYVEPPQVQRLRGYSNYLSPVWG